MVSGLWKCLVRVSSVKVIQDPQLMFSLMEAYQRSNLCLLSITGSLELIWKLFQYFRNTILPTIICVSPFKVDQIPNFSLTSAFEMVHCKSGLKR